MNKRILVWSMSLGFLAIVVGLLLWSYSAHHAELAAETQGDAAITNPARVSADNGGPVVTLDDDAQERMDVKTQPVAAMTRHRQVLAYGALEEDPSGSFVLRAPLAGTIQGTQGKAWPTPGESIADNARVGQIEPRLAPSDRVTLNDRMATSQADMEASRASLAAAQLALSRARILNADDRNVSDRVVQEAEARVATEQAHLNGAQQSVRLLTAALASSRDASVALEIARGGMVAEVMAHPGESVESGQPILRVTRFDKLLARVDVPAGETVATGLTSASIVPLGNDAKPLTGERIGFAAGVDPKTQGQPFLFRIADPGGMLRPGLSVTAYLETPGPARVGSVVPRSAVVWQTGKSWVYVRTAKDKFARREVVLEDPAPGGWFTGSLKPGDAVVTRGAQLLLSEEFKSQIRIEDDQN